MLVAIPPVSRLPRKICAATPLAIIVIADWQSLGPANPIHARKATSCSLAPVKIYAALRALLTGQAALQPFWPTGAFQLPNLIAESLRLSSSARGDTSVSRLPR